MNYRNKNTRNAILSFLGFSVAFYFFFYTFKFRILLTLILSAFLTISIFFSPSKIEKLKKQEETDIKAKELAEEIKSKEISDEDLDNLDLNNVEGYEDDKKDAE